MNFLSPFTKIDAKQKKYLSSIFLVSLSFKKDIESFSSLRTVLH